MEAINPLRNLVNSTTRGTWYPLHVFVSMVVSEFSKVGFEEHTPKNIATIMAEMKFSGFIEHELHSVDQVRIAERWYESV